MRIIYVGRHEQSTGNDDEQAIYHALTQLGHEVFRVREFKGRNGTRVENPDLLLFHHWNDVASIKSYKCLKAFWYFDLVEYPDPTLEKRNVQRRQWMKQITPLVDIGFCTDGDWVNKDKTEKLVRLTQGADERVIGFGQRREEMKCQILFTGMRNGGLGRSSFVDEMSQRYWHTFKRVEGVHGRNLADQIASSQIVVAPDHPVTDNYWSNRVYLTLGFGGFLLHPESKTLREQYADGEGLFYYTDRENLHYLVTEFLVHHPEARERVARAGLERTASSNLYRHRCESLIATVKERFGL